MIWVLLALAVALIVAVVGQRRAWRRYRAACRRTDEAFAALRHRTTACYSVHLGPRERCPNVEEHDGICAS